ncbi:uncharacterized protein [Rutidosis leptorrhynchoides]|uniref:uncharacterized protein n=1 Tax=Rutidosis leptorrhynchoides TaxID=125765 RepID=UPI003A994B85
MNSNVDGDISEPDQNDQNSDHGVKGDTYKKLLEECDKELYPGCKYSNLSFTLHLYHIKCIGGISDKAFGMLLEPLKSTFPHLTSIPSSVSEAKKLTKDLGLGYEKIDACPNDCMLYWGERKGQQSCHVCKAPRYESDMGGEMTESSKSHKSKKPAKVFHYFPLILRLKRLYMSEKTAKDMRWHNTGLTKDGKLRHPADGLAWKAFDARYPEFASDPHNVRLGLASDGLILIDQFDNKIGNEGPPVGLTGSDILKQVSGSSFKYGKSHKSNKRKRDDVGCSETNSLHTYIVTEDSFTFEGIESFIEEDIDGENQLRKKKSIFFDLPYWEYNLLRHNLYVMHIEKNVCDNLLGTLLNIDGKTKDNENTREDLKDMGIRPELHIKKRPNRKTYLPPASYTMSNLEKSNFLKVLKKLKVPDGYASNISRGVSLKDRKLFNLKSHDGHILMQDILPIALRISMISRTQSRVVKVVSDFFSLFKGLCAKTLGLSELEKMEHKVVLTLYLMRLKSYVRNKAQPEGSIAEGYIKEECLNFCSRYFEGVETRFNRPPRNDDNILGKEKYIFNSGGCSIGKVELIELDSKSLSQVYLLEKNKLDEEVISLSMGPNIIARQYSGLIMNGFRFLTRRREGSKKTQNSGVCVLKPSKGLKKDKYGFPLVNYSRPLIHTGEKLTDDPYIISSQAKQVFYIDDIKEIGWSHVIMTKPRDTYDMGTNLKGDDDESYTQCMPNDIPMIDEETEAPSWLRIDDMYES